MKRKMCVVTGSRAEYGLWKPLLYEMKNDKAIDLQLVVTGMHLSHEFGYTVNEIMNDGFIVTERVDTLLTTDTCTDIGKSIGIGVIGLVECFKKLHPDIVLVVGDRFEMFAAVTAATAMNLPIGHFSGGDITEGAVDNQLRHAITKLSHIHFSGNEKSAERIKQMGEEPWRIHVIGELCLDNIKNLKKMTIEELEKKLSVELSSSPLIVVTYHPVTLQPEQTKIQITNLLSVLGSCKEARIIFTYPNADAGGQFIISSIKKFLQKNSNAKAFESLGGELYLNLLSYANLCVGNSSSGLVEAPSFGLPVVNIGERQKGRLLAKNVICASGERENIELAIKKGMSGEFRKKMKNIENPYARGGAVMNALKVLHELEYGLELLNKKFVEYKLDNK